MKKMMILVSAIMMAATANAKRVETASFDEVRLNVPARVRIVAGDSYSVNITSTNESLASAVRLDVKDGVLRINTRDVEAFAEEAEKLCITIVTPREPKLTTSRDLQTKVLRNSFKANEDMAKND